MKAAAPFSRRGTSSAAAGPCSGREEEGEDPTPGTACPLGGEHAASERASSSPSCGVGTRKANREPFEAPRSPVNTARGAVIWAVRVSAKPTKCLQPTSPRCTRYKPGTGFWLTSLPGVSSPLPRFFFIYIHTLVSQTHAFIARPYTTHISQHLTAGSAFLAPRAPSV